MEIQVDDDRRRQVELVQPIEKMRAEVESQGGEVWQHENGRLSTLDRLH